VIQAAAESDPREGDRRRVLTPGSRSTAAKRRLRGSVPGDRTLEMQQQRRCRGRHEPAASAVGSQKVCSGACRRKRSRRFARGRRRRRVQDARVEERERQQRCRARRRAGRCRSPQFDQREIFGVSLVRAASLELIDRRVLSLLITVLAAARSALRTRGALALENLALRQQLAVLQRRRPRPPLDWTDRLSDSDRDAAITTSTSRWRGPRARRYAQTPLKAARFRHGACKSEPHAPPNRSLRCPRCDAPRRANHARG
jgi:hypothetical protein